MSGIILSAYYLYLNKEDYGIDCLMDYECYKSKNYKNLFNAPSTNEDLFKYFSIGDTIVVSIYAEKKKLFNTYGSSVRGIDVILGTKVKKNKINNVEAEYLVIHLLHVPNPRGKTPQYRAGDTVEETPYYCSLIPPVD